MKGAPKRFAHRRGRRWILYCLVLIAAFGFMWTGGLLWFASTLPKSVTDPLRKTDAIVVLTGGSGRLEQGFDLIEQQLAKKLFVSGVHQGVEVEELLKIFQRSPSGVTCCMTLGRAVDTVGNAAETEEWMTQQGYQSLRLVTAAYHMPRSLVEFNRVMPTIQIIPNPVFPVNFKQHDWWRWPGSAGLIVTEYNKYLVALLRSYIIPA
ncbi:YdcF family protein [Denitrobaculum tricleocarpae]|uniref:YdcF family protein n=1 Tax=Denitrobaculum tricleocarpae TaxID=2591009 RepID=A0A545U1Q8_9PROT|nr:YdcF family protein [Denitrobaculum tricleocarpae]TQV83398.1 YdcF family protein [Denitrobaculum tricleocarpae]